LWKATAGAQGNDLTWDNLYYVEKNTFLEFGDQDDLEGQAKPLRRVHSDSSLSTGNGSRRGSFTPGLQSNSSSAAPQSSQPRWHHGCYMKYRMGACNEPSCSYLHDLDSKERACFLALTEREKHIVFRSERSDSSVGRDRSRDLGDHSEFSSDDDEEAQPDSSRRDSQQQPRAYHNLIQQLRDKFKDYDNADLVACLPCDSAGQATSIGSTLHMTAQCKPCRYKIMQQPCADGVRCMYCHMDHNLSTSLESVNIAQQPTADGGGKSKVRPCKGKRDRYRKHVSRITEQIMANPFSWSVDRMEIPPSIECNPELKRKFLARMAVIAEHARTQGAQAVASSSAGAAGAVATESSPMSSGPLQASSPSSVSGMAAGSNGLDLAAVDPSRRRNLLSL